MRRVDTTPATPSAAAGADRCVTLALRVGMIACLLAGAGCGGASAGAAIVDSDVQLATRVDGEFGLWVRRAGDSIRVGWLTADSAAGRLRVLDGSNVVLDVSTPPGRAHSAAFAAADHGSVMLRYGTAAVPSSQLHETEIVLERPRRGPVRIDAVDSLFVISDIHGEFDTMISVLHNAGLINDALQWTGGRAHLAVVGDVLDRGDAARRALWLLYRLEREAARAGGGVDFVLGNHELMVMLGDLRYVGPGERAIAATYGTPYNRMFDPRNSILGAWLASKPGVIRIDDVLLAHGGVSTEYLNDSLESLDDTLAAYVGEDLFYHWADTTATITMDSAAVMRRVDFFSSPTSVFWYRDYAQLDTLRPQLDSVLRRFDARIHVIGHTPGDMVRARYDGALLAVNTIPFAAQLLLLVREPAGWRRYRIGSSGPPVPF